MFEEYARGLPCTVKIVTTAPGAVLSCHYHHKHSEIWIVLDPRARAETRSPKSLPSATCGTWRNVRDVPPSRSGSDRLALP
jgi:oxalate decarboxylase/phosphoglucose isomerase-like protein (cupin superfamily)